MYVAVYWGEKKKFKKKIKINTVSWYRNHTFLKLGLAFIISVAFGCLHVIKLLLDVFFECIVKFMSVSCERHDLDNKA